MIHMKNRISHSKATLLLVLYLLLGCSSSSQGVRLIISHPNGSIEEKTLSATPLIGKEHQCTSEFSCLRLTNNLYINFDSKFVRSYNLAFGHTLNGQRLQTDIESPSSFAVVWNQNSLDYGFCYPSSVQTTNCILISIVRAEAGHFAIHQARIQLPPDALQSTIRTKQWLSRANTAILDSRPPFARIFLIRRDSNIDSLEF